MLRTYADSYADPNADANTYANTNTDPSFRFMRRTL